MIPKEHSKLIVERLGRGGYRSEFVVVLDAGHLVLLEKRPR